MKGGGFIAEVKQRTDVELVTVSPDDRDGLPASPFCSRPDLLTYDPKLPE